MIDLYTWTTPNGYKASIMLEECGLDYEVHPVDIGAGEQFSDAFLKVGPNGKIPAIVDQDGEGGPVSVFESGAILIYLAEKAGTLLPKSGADRATTLEWLMWQMAGVGPILGQTNHFVNVAEEKIPYAMNRFLDESARLFAVMDRRLGDAEYLAGDYSIADVACYPWVKVGFEVIRGAKPDVVGDGAQVSRWLEAVGARPAVERGMQVPKL